MGGERRVCGTVCPESESRDSGITTNSCSLGTYFQDNFTFYFEQLNVVVWAILTVK